MIENESTGQTLYSVSEVATLVGLVKHTIYKYIQEGKIRGQKIGRNIYFSEEDIKNFLESRKG